MNIVEFHQCSRAPRLACFSIVVENQMSVCSDILHVANVLSNIQCVVKLSGCVSMLPSNEGGRLQCVSMRLSKDYTVAPARSPDGKR